MSNNVEEKILHGTTTVGLKAKDGVVLCADMRASAGYFIANNNTMKIQKIDDHVGMTMAGGVADFYFKELRDVYRLFEEIIDAGNTCDGDSTCNEFLRAE